MPSVLRRSLVIAGLALTCLAWPALAQETVRVRGTIERMDGAAYVVKTRDGQVVKVTLGDKPLFVAMVKASMADIKPGMFVGSTAMPVAGGDHAAAELGRRPRRGDRLGQRLRCRLDGRRIGGAA